jgi:hypothetical protein
VCLKHRLMQLSFGVGKLPCNRNMPHPPPLAGRHHTHTFVTYCSSIHVSIPALSILYAETGQFLSVVVVLMPPELAHYYSLGCAGEIPTSWRSPTHHQAASLTLPSGTHQYHPGLESPKPHSLSSECCRRAVIGRLQCMARYGMLRICT